jgi:hypothetical protein
MAGYKAVHALMLCWEGCEDAFRDQRSLMSAELRKWNFEVEEYDIDANIAAHRRLNGRLLDFLNSKAATDTLLIVYYNGHGQNDDDKASIWAW